MKPGRITLSGFLGNDPRNLVDIIVEDDAKVKRLNVTHKKIARKMIEFKQKGIKGMGDFIKIDPHFEVKVETVRGKLPCPFGDPGIFPKINTYIKNLRINKNINYTDLNIHMIWAHGFYEGKGSKFRLDPETIVEVLEINEIEDNYEI
jgi:hypothetical protein